MLACSIVISALEGGVTDKGFAMLAPVSRLGRINQQILESLELREILTTDFHCSDMSIGENSKHQLRLERENWHPEEAILLDPVDVREDIRNDRGT